MVEFLSAAFVTALLVVLVVVCGIGALLCILAGKGNPAARWLAGCLLAAGLLVYILGGFAT